MEKLKFYIIILLLFTIQACENEKPRRESNVSPQLVLGDDRLLGENLDLIMGRRIGVVANKASTLSNGVLITDTLSKIKGINFRLIFTPEHGFNISDPAGKTVSDSAEGNIPVYSLYGKIKKPSAEALKDIDLIIFDLQDIGTRFYTYISTLYYVMQAASESKVPIVVLDRPNPIGGIKVEGPVLQPGLVSFIGIAELPVVHGMTMGELAKLFAGRYIADYDSSLLTVIKMKNWRRDSYFNDYKLKWTNPSPNIPDLETAVIYPATALLEGTNISEGRGTRKPFKQIGAPFINSDELSAELHYLKHEGMSISPVSFVPAGISGKSENPKYRDQECSGIELKLLNADSFSSMKFGIRLLYALHKLYPEKFIINSEYFDKLAGNKIVREMLLASKEPDQIIESWQPELKRFLSIRNQYLLY